VEQCHWRVVMVWVGDKAMLIVRFPIK